MPRKEDIVYFEPQEKERVPLALRFRAVGILLREILSHPLTETIIEYDTSNNKLIVKRGESVKFPRRI
jgi:hypothetical protein